MRSQPETESALLPRIAGFDASDGYRFYSRVWDVPQPISRVVCLHGIISHGGWYLESCQHLARAGMEVHFVDRRGSGLNPLDCGDVPNYERWIEDIQEYLAALPADVPRLLVGISWGGKLAVALAAGSPHLLDGLALVCPGIFALRGPNALQKRLLRFAAARRMRRRRVQIPLQQADLFTSVPRWQRMIDADPLVLRRITLRGAWENVKLDRHAQGLAGRIHTPSLLMTAGRDRIIDNSRVIDFYSRISAPQKHIDYPQAAHTFEFEPDPGPYFQDLTDWLQSQSIDTEKTGLYE